MYTFGILQPMSSSLENQDVTFFTLQKVIKGGQVGGNIHHQMDPKNTCHLRDAKPRGPEDAIVITRAWFLVLRVPTSQCKPSDFSCMKVLLLLQMLTSYQLGRNPAISNWYGKCFKYLLIGCHNVWYILGGFWISEPSVAPIDFDDIYLWGFANK